MFIHESWPPQLAQLADLFAFYQKELLPLTTRHQGVSTWDVTVSFHRQTEHLLGWVAEQALESIWSQHFQPQQKYWGTSIYRSLVHNSHCCQQLLQMSQLTVAVYWNTVRRLICEFPCICIYANITLYLHVTYNIHIWRLNNNGPHITLIYGYYCM